MKKRLFLILFVLFLLLATMGKQHVQNPAALVGGDKVLGFIPLWELYNILPAGLFAAGVSAAALGMGAEFWRALLPLCGATRVPLPALSRMADAGLWCGWLTLAVCIKNQSNIFPGISEQGTGMYSEQAYELVLQIGGLCMVLCRILALRLKEKAALPIVILSAATALVCGQYWCREQAIGFLTLSLLLPWGLLLLWRPTHLSSQLFYMTLTALGMTIYGLSFAPTISNYVPADSIGPSTATSAILPTIVLLLMLLLKPLGFTQKARQQQVTGLFILTCVLLPLWYLVATGTAGAQLAERLPLVIACYLVPLFCLSGLIALRLWATAPPQNKEN